MGPCLNPFGYAWIVLGSGAYKSSVPGELYDGYGQYIGLSIWLGAGPISVLRNGVLTSDKLWSSSIDAMKVPPHVVVDSAIVRAYVEHEKC